MSNFFAGSNLSAGSYTPEELLAGESDVITKPEVLLKSGKIAAYTVLGRVTLTGKLVVADLTKNDGSEKACAILCEAIDATADDVTAPVYLAGEFLRDSLVWGASFDTAAKKNAAFHGTAIVTKVVGFSG